MTNPPSRPIRWLWFLAKFAGGMLLVACAVYGVIAYRYFSQTPRLTRNFAAELNAPILEIPKADRAWPLYRIALEKLSRRLPSEIYVSDEYLESPDRERFRASAMFAQNRKVLSLIKAAAARPRMGFVLSDQWTAEDLPWLKNSGDGREQTLGPASANPDLMAVLLPPPDDMQLLVELLCFDAWEAAAAGDGACVVDDLSAAIAIAGHFRELPLAVGQVVSWRLLRFAMAMLRWIVVEYPVLTNENGLDVLAKGLAKYSQDAPITLQLASERMMFEDVAQRMYTDDGAGDGRLLAHNSKFRVDGVIATPAAIWFGDDVETKLLAPFVSWRSPGRREVLEIYHRAMDASEAACAEPLWRFPGLPEPPELQLAMFPTLSNAYLLSQKTAQERGATLVAIALTRYHRQHGRWPTTLEEAPLDGLSDAIVDFHTGGSLQYRLVEDVPLLYSLGADKDDDGGRPAASSAEEESSRRRALRAAPDQSKDGDWILLPATKPEVYEQLSGM
jgi:hypothetical protein